MANKYDGSHRDQVAHWAKRCYFAGRAVMEAELRQLDVGSTQWYVLALLAEAGPTRQRDMVEILELERATLSIVVSALCRKGLVSQVPDSVDQRQKILHLTRAGQALWNRLPDLAFIRDVAFGEASEADLAVTVSVLKAATERLTQHLLQGDG